MSSFNPSEIQYYVTSLNQQIDLLKLHQDKVNNSKTNPASNELISELSELRNIIVKTSKKNWFQKYLDIFGKLFFISLIKQYIDLIKPAYLSLWLQLNQVEQIEFAKVSDDTFQFPNAEILSTNNFGELINKEFANTTKSGVIMYDLEYFQSSSYEPTLGVDEYIYMLTDHHGNTFVLKVYVFEQWIKVKAESSSFAFNFCSAFLRQLLLQICNQQLKGKKF